MKRFYVILFSILSTSLLGGQDANAQNKKPFWADGYFQDVDNSYIEVVSAISWDEKDARQKAAQEIVSRRSLATGSDAVVKLSGSNVEVQGNHDLIVKSRVIAEYCECLQPGSYKVYLLTQTAKNPTYQLESVTITNKYPFSARVFVPGMAQIYKGSKGKGASMIALEAVGVAGIVTSFSLQASYKNLMQQDKKHMSQYATMADTWTNVGYGSIAFTAAVYVWSLIDGCVAKGQEHIVVKKPHNFAVAPTIDSFGNAALAIQYKF